MAIVLIENYPLISLLVISFIITLVLTLVYKHFSNQEEIKKSKDKMKELQGKIKEEKDPDKIMAMQKEMLETNMEHLRHNMKPLLITFLPLIAVFWWLRTTFVPFGILIPYNVTFPGSGFLLPGLWDGAGWFLVYVFSSFIYSISLRKLLDVH